MKLWFTMLVVIAGCKADANFGKPAEGATAAATGAAATTAVLPRLESATTPDGAMETYDHIKRTRELAAAAAKAGQPPPPGAASAKPLPPTLVDTFASDVRLLAFYDLGAGKLEKDTITVEQVAQVIQLYVKLGTNQLRGLRPLAHKAFVTSLSDAERTQLATEVVAHVKKTGFLGDDSIGSDAPPPRSAAAQAALGGAAPAAPANTAAAALPSDVPLYAGIYRTTEGDALLIQLAASPKKVIGAYAKGKLYCDAEGSTLTCDWEEKGSPGGRAQFTRADDGNMKGAWGMGKRTSGGGKWNWTLLAAGKLE